MFENELQAPIPRAVAFRSIVKAFANVFVHVRPGFLGLGFAVSIRAYLAVPSKFARAPTERV